MNVYVHGSSSSLLTGFLIFGCVSASDGSVHSLHYHVTCCSKSEYVMCVVSVYSQFVSCVVIFVLRAV